MTRRPDPARPTPPPPAFDPVPVRSRRDGWTPDRQRAFIAALADGQGITRAARSVGMSRETAYRLRDRPGAESFAAAWAEVMSVGFQHPLDTGTLHYRALHGVVRPIVRDGRIVGHVHKFDNRALLVLQRRMDKAERARRQWHGPRPQCDENGYDEFLRLTGRL